MDFYDRGILTILRKGEPRTFQQILSKAGFSHNTLRQHLDELVDQGLVERG
jgi:DNA-binding Lrp family transcriptional regulator